MDIKYVDHSLSNRFENHIEINRNLKNYPKLLQPILEHELSHSDKPWSIEDFKLDFVSNNNINHWELFKFMLKHPKSFYQLLPIYYSKEKGFVYDVNLIIMFIILFSIFILTIYFGVKKL